MTELSDVRRFAESTVSPSFRPAGHFEPAAVDAFTNKLSDASDRAWEDRN